MRRLAIALSIVLSSPTLAAAHPDDDRDLQPDGKGSVPRGHAPHEGHAGGPARSKTGNGIYYHGGPLILGTASVYYIWYGDWSADSSAFTILTGLAQNIGGSSYYNINTTYYYQSSTGATTPVSNSVNYATAATCTSASTDGCWRGSSNLADGDIEAVVQAKIGSGALPADPQGVYFVLTAPDVTKSGFCTQYCGWHTHASIGGVDVKFAFIGDAYPQCPSACLAQTTSPNNDPGADGMVNVIAHELSESVTDPDLNAWYDRMGQENADKCAWTFGSTYITSNGAKANVSLGGLNYLIQRNWVNASGGYCALSY